MPIEIRADSGCATPALYAFCERHHLGYTIGVVTNSRLEAIAAPLLAAARAQQALPVHAAQLYEPEVFGQTSDVGFAGW